MNTQSYDEMNRQVKRACKLAKENWLEEKCQEIENLEKQHLTRQMHEQIRRVTHPCMQYRRLAGFPHATCSSALSRVSRMLHLIWHFCSQCKTNKLEKFQERALRFVYNDYISSHADLLKTAGAEYLHIKRAKEMAREVFKIVNNIAPTFIETLIALKRSQYCLRNEKTAVVPPKLICSRRSPTSFLFSILFFYFYVITCIYFLLNTVQ